MPVLAPDHLQVRERRAGVHVRCRLKCLDRSGDAVMAAFTSAKAVAATNMAAAKTATSRLPPMDASVAAHVPSVPFAPTRRRRWGTREVRCDEGVNRHERREERQQGRALIVPLDTRGRLVVVAIARRRPPRRLRVPLARAQRQSRVKLPEGT